MYYHKAIWTGQEPACQGSEALLLSSRSLFFTKSWLLCISAPSLPSSPMSSPCIQYHVYFLNLHMELVCWPGSTAELPDILLMGTVSAYLDLKWQENLMAQVYLFGHLFPVSCFCPLLVQPWPLCWEVERCAAKLVSPSTRWYSQINVRKLRDKDIDPYHKAFSPKKGQCENPWSRNWGRVTLSTKGNFAAIQILLWIRWLPISSMFWAYSVREITELALSMPIWIFLVLNYFLIHTVQS